MRLLLLLLLLASPCWAAINAASQWEIRTTGLSTNGGCWYNSGGSSTDYSQQDAPQLSTTDVTSDAAGVTWTSAIGGFTANMVGNCARMSGTNFTTGTYQITGFTSGNVVTVDRDSTSGAAASLGVARVGGGLIDTWTVPPIYVAGNTVWIKAGTYTRTTTLFAMATTGTATAPVEVRGYTTTHGDSTGNAASWTGPVLTTATNSINVLTVNGQSFTTIRNIKFTHTAATRGGCVVGVTAHSSPIKIEDSVFSGCSTAIDFGNLSWADTKISNVYITGSTVHAINMGTGSGVGFMAVLDSVIYNNTGSGIECATGIACTLEVFNTVFSTNTDGIRTTATTRADRWYLKNNTFAANTSNGVESAETTTAATIILENNIFYGNTTGGVNFAFASSGTDHRVITNKNNAYGGNGTDRTGLSAGTNDVALTGDPFTSSTNWALNNTAGAGAACRAAGFPGALMGGVTTGYLDIGAVQHQDSGGAAVTRSFPFVM